MHWYDNGVTDLIGNGKVWEKASQNRIKHLEKMSLSRAKMSLRGQK